MGLRPVSWPAALRSGAAWLVVGFVAWRAFDGANRSWSELVSRARADHLRLFTASPEQLVARRLGADFGIYRTLRAHVSGAAVVRVSFVFQGAERKALKNRMTKLSSLLYPIVLVGWLHDPRTEPPPPLEPGREALVIDLDSGRDYSRWPVCEVLAEGPRWKVLRLGTGPG